MKPPLPQWDSRFYLAKLSDYEIKSRFIVKKQKKPTITHQKVELPQQIAAEELHNLWHQLQVPLFHRAYFLQYSSETTREISQLLDRSAPVLRLQTLIKGREKCLRFLREDFEENKFSELLCHLRLLTLNVLEQFQRWRQQLHNVVRWRIDEIDYVEKIRNDTLFLSEFYEEYNRKDIFFLWLVKKAYFHQGVHHLYNLVPKEVLKRIREMEVMLIELEYQDQQTNILSRKDDQLVKKYLKEEVEITDTTARLDLIEIFRVNEEDQNLKNDEDIEQSFPIFQIDQGQEWEILELRKNNKIVGQALCQCEDSEEYKKWMIGKIKLKNMDDFPQFLELITKELEGNEIQIKLIHYLQNQILIDNAQLKQYLKKSGYRWKQQTNDNNCRYTIYYKRKEYTITPNLKLRIVLAKSPHPQILQHIHSDDKEFSQYLSDTTKSSGLQLKTTTNSNQIDLLLLQINFPEIQTEVHNSFKYIRLKDITMQDQNYAIEIDKYVILISYLPDQIYNHKLFQPTTQDLLLPMFHNHQTRIDTFNYHQHVEFNHFIPFEKKSLDQQTILIDSPFYLTLYNNTQQLFSILVTEFLPYENQNQNILQIDQSIFTLPEFPLIPALEAFQINIQGTQFVLGIDNHAYTRKWVIYTMNNYDVQLNLQNATQWIIQQDPYAQEIALNFHHQFIDQSFQINQIVQKQIVQAGFRWKQQNNEHQIRYTKYLKKLNNTLLTQNLLIHIYCQKPQHLNIQPLLHQLSQFETAFTQSQLSVRKGVMLPFTKYTSDMLTTEIHQVLNASKYDETHFLIHRSQIMQSKCSMGQVYFINCKAITLCFLQCNENLQRINEEILHNAEEQCEMSSDLVVPNIDKNYDLLNMGMQFTVSESFKKKVKSEKKLILKMPFFVGIIEPDWLEKHNEMICSLIIQ